MKRKIIGITVGTPISIERIGKDLKPEIKEYIDERLGAVEDVLDGIIAIQNSLIGGESK